MHFYKIAPPFHIFPYHHKLHLNYLYNQLCPNAICRKCALLSPWRAKHTQLLHSNLPLNASLHPYYSNNQPLICDFHQKLAFLYLEPAYINPEPSQNLPHFCKDFLNLLMNLHNLHGFRQINLFESIMIFNNTP